MQDLKNTMKSLFDQMGTIPTGDSDLFHSKDANYSKRWKATTWNTYLWENPHTGRLTGINYLLWWTSLIKSIPQDFTVAKSCFDLSSYHSPILIILRTIA
jgi:hypothetical protein